jgi:glycosyltransferase involved in cell wall biosynthesis
MTPPKIDFSKSLTNASIRMDHCPAGTSIRFVTRQRPSEIRSAARLIGSTPAERRQQVCIRCGEAVSQWRPDKSILLPYGVRNDLFTTLSDEERRSVRERFGIPEDGVVFITIGSAGRRKGYDLLAQAFAALGGKHHKWFLWLVGPMSQAEGCGTDERELAEMMAPLQQFEAQVRRFGRIDDRGELRRLIGASDVLVFPTRREGIGVAPMEAMAMRLPVVVSRIPGVTDVACVDQETGLLVPVGDAEALARAMERLGSDAGLRDTFGSKARQRINKEFSWGGHIAQWEKLYSNGAA